MQLQTHNIDVINEIVSLIPTTSPNDIAKKLNITSFQVSRIIENTKKKLRKMVKNDEIKLKKVNHYINMNLTNHFSKNISENNISLAFEHIEYLQENNISLAFEHIEYLQEQNLLLSKRLYNLTEYFKSIGQSIKDIELKMIFKIDQNDES